MADHGFDITVDETTAKHAERDLEGAMRAGEAMHAHDLALAGDEVKGWSDAHHSHVSHVAEAAAELVAAVAGAKGKARVALNGDADHVNVSVQRLA